MKSSAGSRRGSIRLRAMVWAVIVNAAALGMTLRLDEGFLVVAWSYLIQEIAITTTVTLRMRRIELLWLSGIHFAEPPMATNRFFRLWSENALWWCGLLLGVTVWLVRTTQSAGDAGSGASALDERAIGLILLSGALFVLAELAFLAEQFEGDLRNAPGVEQMGQAAWFRVLLLAITLGVMIQYSAVFGITGIAVAKTLGDLAGIAAQPWARG